MSKNWVIFGALGAAALGGYLVYRGSKNVEQVMKLAPANQENVTADQQPPASNGNGVGPVATDPLDLNIPMSGISGMFGNVRIL